ncbi:hypothetical protein [Acinetobacter beijerinckii]|uniref:Uncharacterized protein n=1 Tax=Acinetobacter beijerinckii ANC 3835 TaxID=1217649 RepID=N9E5I9_9GAMM|nr:hypothetical protein [Acinetobacter beijerinckii]ENW05758.1 hypothetical protein F934_01115 [Acinetobacter beijerinckii ANC 3835]
MSNIYNRFFDMLPRTPEFIGTVQSADHPNYKVLVADGTGLVLCTSSTVFNAGDKVYISGNEIKRSAPTGVVYQIEV